MADATLTLVSGSPTPFSIVYEAVGGATAGLLSWTTLQHDLVAGPLKAHLTKLAATAAGFTVLNLEGASADQKVRIYIVVGKDDTEGCNAAGSINIHWVANGLSVVLPVQGAESQGTLTFEIRFRHSRKR